MNSKIYTVALSVSLLAAVAVSGATMPPLPAKVKAGASMSGIVQPPPYAPIKLTTNMVRMTFSPRPLAKAPAAYSPKDARNVMGFLPASFNINPRPMTMVVYPGDTSTTSCLETIQVADEILNVEYSFDLTTWFLYTVLEAQTNPRNVGICVTFPNSQLPPMFIMRVVAQ